MLLLITDTSPVCHILWNNKDSLLGIKLSASSAQLLTKRLITHESDEMSKKMRSLFGQSLFGQSLSRDDLRVICAAVVNDHNKLRDFAEIYYFYLTQVHWLLTFLKNIVSTEYNCNYNYFNRYDIF